MKRGEFRDIDGLPVHRIEFTGGLTLPTELESMNELDNDEQDDYFDLYDDTYSAPIHYMLGYANPVRDSVEWKCAIWSNFHKQNALGDELARNVIDDEGNWQFLFQIDSDDSLNVMWGDAGTLYVCIPKQSLKERKFEDCWTIIEST